jgi:phage-related protein
MPEINLKELLDDHETFVNSLPKCKDIIPQLVVAKDDELKVFIITGGVEREGIKKLIEMMEKTKPDWIVFITEAYTKKLKNPEELEDYRHGMAEKEFKAGSKDVKEIVVIQAYSKQGKMMRTLDKVTGEKYQEDVEEFSGYFTVDDVERVFWSDSK